MSLQGGPVRRFIRERRERLRGVTKGRRLSRQEWASELTLSQIDTTIRDIQRYIEDEKRVERYYYTESENPVIKAINANNIFLEMSKEEKTHAQELEALLPKLKEKWEEVYRKLV
jgi:rubrerythrin